MCNITLQPGVVILFTVVRDTIMTGCATLSQTNIFATSIKARAKLQPHLARVTLSGSELTESCRFGSSGLNLSFEGLLLGVNIRVLTEGIRSKPC
jgi:hypothetical protein